jgi:hypothetical protein
MRIGISVRKGNLAGSWSLTRPICRPFMIVEYQSLLNNNEMFGMKNEKFKNWNLKSKEQWGAMRG